MTDKAVIVLGHSLVPRSIGTVNGANIEILRSPGAKVYSFTTNPVLSKILNIPHDFTILFLGGNDINDNCVPSVIAQDIQNVIEQIHSYCGSHIAFVLIEHREPPPNNRFNVTATSYNRIANNINNRLKRKLKNKPYVRFLSVGAKPFHHGTTDGIHFDRDTNNHLKLKLQNSIQRFVDSCQQ